MYFAAARAGHELADIVGANPGAGHHDQPIAGPGDEPSQQLRAGRGRRCLA